MKLLVLDEEFPYPLNSGKRIRSYNLIVRLAKRHHVRYLAFGGTDSESFRQFELDNLNPIAVSPSVAAKHGAGFYLRLAANLFSTYPYIVNSHYSPTFQRTLEKAIAADRPDLIICEWTPYARYVTSILTIPKVVVAHNIETTVWRRYYENEKNVLKRWYIKHQVEKLTRFERTTFASVEGATAVTNDEAEQIARMNHSLSVQVVANGVDLEYFRPRHERSEKRRIVFTGAMDWRPNQDAVSYFVEQIFPRLRQYDRQLEAVMVGRNPPESIRRYNRLEGITITGTVDDVRPFMEQAAVYIVPLRIGGGSRLKILEALAMEKAVVSTSVGAEGLKVVNGRDVILADTPKEFAEQVIELLNRTDRRRSLGSAGRQLVQRHYGWPALAERLERFLLTILEEK